MGTRINLNKKQIIEVEGNGLELILEPDSNNAINIHIASIEGGRLVGVKPHDNEPNTFVVYLKDLPYHPKFTVI